MLYLTHLADRHVQPGWVRTIYLAQGTTCDRVMANLESFRANTDACVANVAISRTRAGAVLYTDDRARLTDVPGVRSETQIGTQIGTIDEAITHLPSLFPEYRAAAI